MIFIELHNHYKVLQHFYQLKKFPCAHWQNHSLLPPANPMWTLICLQSGDLPFLRFHINGIIQCNILCLSLSIMCLRFIYVVPCISTVDPWTTWWLGTPTPCAVENPHTAICLKNKGNDKWLTPRAGSWNSVDWIRTQTLLLKIPNTVISNQTQTSLT